MKTKNRLKEIFDFFEKNTKYLVKIKKDSSFLFIFENEECRIEIMSIDFQRTKVVVRFRDKSTNDVLILFLRKITDSEFKIANVSIEYGSTKIEDIEKYTERKIEDFSNLFFRNKEIIEKEMKKKLTKIILEA